MGICAKCKKKTPGNYTICYACSEKIKQQKFARFGEKRCSKCGTKISQDKSLCWTCYKKTHG